MIVLSAQHAWQGNKAIQQILVFSNEFAYNKFNKIMAVRKKEMLEKQEVKIDNCVDVELGEKDLCDNNAGAMYKLRAVKNFDGFYIPMICCGFTGFVLYEGHKEYEVYRTSELALRRAGEILKASIDSDFADLVTNPRK